MTASLLGKSESSWGLSLAHPVVCIVGPTASGKTDVAQLVAKGLESLHGGCGVVVSADSMQIYRGMDIGTGKIAPEEMVVDHFGLDICDPGQAYSAALFQEYARDVFSTQDNRGNTCVLAGGTGLYVRAAIDDYRFPKGDQVGNPTREKWQAFLDSHGAQELWNELHRVDPESAALIHANNSKRVIRAFEMLELEGTSYARQHAGFATMKQFVPACFFSLEVDPELLYARIDARVDRMFEQGLVDEVCRLIDAGFKSAVTARDAIGYKEVVWALDGQCSLHEAKEAIKQASRRYSKRQRSWWRSDERIVPVDANDGDCERISMWILNYLAHAEHRTA
ncbi:MAG: tRNA (adenosine(37)-N6)-dimethylallyltransferase MiaA [Eggerthellales bacterium]|nr:tRNA (adenosine(37)-N6)-dimethylallyltransferase MiaA [Eggerthellales bacterium]